MSGVGVVILNWRQPEATASCLADLRACGHEPLRVLVIDNGSGDGSAERLRGEPNVEVLALPTNLGYCRAVNLGLAWAERAACTHVLLLNNDVRLPPGFLPPLVDVLESDPSVAGVMPSLVDREGKVWSEGAEVRFGPNLVRLHNQGAPPTATDQGPRAVGFLPGACALYRLADLRAVGGLDEEYFMYLEDAELGERLRARGKKLLHVPWFRAVHAAGTSSGGGRSPLRKFLMGRNAVLFARKHGGLRLWSALVLFEVLLWPLALVSGTGARAALAKARGLWRGLRGGSVGAADVEANL